MICFCVDNFIKKSESCTNLAGLLCVVLLKPFFKAAQRFFPEFIPFAETFG